MASNSTITDLLASGHDDAVAIEAPGREPMTFAGLRALTSAVGADLNRLGIGRGDRVAIVLANGPEMATAFLGIGASAATAPLNPGYRRAEFEFYLSDLRASALVVEEGSDTPAIGAAAELGVEVIRIAADTGADDRAGSWSFVERDRIKAGPRQSGPAGSDDEALVLHTSGTTSRPKIVPLLQRNIAATAGNITRTLRLSEQDRCLNVMPLFHIHGLMACVLSPLSAGGSTYFTPGFDALKFYTWLAEADPTWYSAVPSMHQAVLARSGHNEESIASADLRFIRSSSASLPPHVMAKLEDVFAAPVVEAYAMTEASHQMTCNPLPPAVRKPGTVGPAAGPDVAIMGENDELLASGVEGEIVIRGDNVTPGYDQNPEANAAAFTAGWFRTGDLGIMDDDSYVTVSGRIKEIINRGGEKISPREVDDVLMDHPAVQQVVTFAVPHRMLGEDVAAVVVLSDQADAEPAAIREFAAQRIAAFKVPRKILIVDEIPKGPTGKVRRIGLAEELGLV